MRDWVHAGQEKCRTVRPDRRGQYKREAAKKGVRTEQVRCKTGEMQGKRNAGEE